MKLVNLDQTIFVPVVDETHGGVTVEMQMTVGEFFAKCCDGFEPEVVEAIPVEWMSKFCADDIAEDQRETIEWMLKVWKREQEAQK
jgi:hypothetical protein